MKEKPTKVLIKSFLNKYFKDKNKTISANF